MQLLQQISQNCIAADVLGTQPAPGGPPKGTAAARGAPLGGSVAPQVAISYAMHDDRVISKNT